MFLNKRILAALLAALMLGCTLSACQNAPVPASSAAAAVEAASSEPASDSSEPDISKQSAASSKKQAASSKKPAASSAIPKAVDTVEAVVVNDLPSPDTTPKVEIPPLQIGSNYPALAESDYRCYNLLNPLQKQVYSKLRDIAAAMTDGDTIPVCSLDDLHLAFVALRNDYPQYFWLPRRYGGSFVPGSKTKINMVCFRFEDPETGEKYDYLYTPAQAKNRTEALNAALGTALSQIPADMDEYGRQLWLHDWLCARLTYDRVAADEVIANGGTHTSHPDSFSAYGALTSAAVVCEGYTRGWQLLLYQVGIQSSPVIGVANNTSGYGAHMWSLMSIGGEWFYSDITWNDGDVSHHAYFNLPYDYMALDHDFYDPFSAENNVEFNFKLPVATTFTQNYAVRNGLMITSGMDVAAQITAAVSAAAADQKNRLELLYGPGITPLSVLNLRAAVQAAGISMKGFSQKPTLSGGKANHLTW